MKTNFIEHLTYNQNSSSIDINETEKLYKTLFNTF